MKYGPFKGRRRAVDNRQDQPRPALDLLHQGTPFVLSEEQRADLTISCRDADYIPKVRNAGQYKRIDGGQAQIMHNGLLVKKGGYYGDWMERIIRELKGHHEPQEEKVFHELLKRLKPGSNMIELGSFWAYYSLWFNKALKNATNICCEPDPNNMKVGKMNADLNDANNVTFISAAAGERMGKVDFPMESNPGELVEVPIIPVDVLVARHKLKKLDLLHMDVQGQELAAIRGSRKTIRAGKLRFLVVSTHHHSISNDPLTHFRCKELIESLGGHIIASHTVLESFSGDGLLAASFKKADKGLHIDVSINSSEHSLYKPYEYDLARMIDAYEQLRREPVHDQ